MIPEAADAERSSAERPRAWVLVVDDDAALRRALRRELEEGGFQVAEAASAEELAPALERRPELVLLDLHLGEGASLGVVREIRERSPHSECVVMTGYASVDTAVACMRAGAFDYLEKPFRAERPLLETLRRALDHRAQRVGRESAGPPLDLVERIVSESPAMKRLVATVLNLAHNQSNVLIEAESGTGKELIARAIHATSARRAGPFVPVDCGALPEGIAEGELFGYERGAFTGAIRSAPGVFRSAHGGTLFLDEIGELSPLLQSKLLRAIQEREVRPLGSDRIVSVDVRLIAATNRDLAEEVRTGRFRSDLFYRLRVVQLRIPPLRERPEDIPVLAHHFLARASGTRVSSVDAEALERLTQHGWEGNVRELQNVIEAAAALAPGPRLRVEDLGLGRESSHPPTVARPQGIGLSMRDYERACIEEALRRAEGRVERAASLLRIGRSTLYRKLRDHGIKTSASDPRP
jgi:DNA-binding NtrC family response regulator